MDKNLENIYEKEIQNFNSTVTKKVKTLENGIVAYKDGTDLILEYQNTRLFIQKFTDDNQEEYFNYKAFNEFDCPIYTLDLTLENTEDPLELFKEWIEAGFPTQSEIERCTGRKFMGSIKDLRKMVRIKNTLM